MKLKRELGTIDASDMVIDHPRTKRRKRGSSVASPSVNEDVDMANGASSDVTAAEKEGTQDVKELGLKIFQAVKTAKGKDDRILSHDFMRLPSKRQYADYYNLIKRPIALDEIKAQLDSNAYPSIDGVKRDFDTCFRNAKKYNIRDSQIWRDAKALHKIVSAEYKALTGTEDDIDVIGSDGGDDGSDEDDGKGKSKGRSGRPTSLNRLIKARMQKLVDKTDDTHVLQGRLMTEVFMELPQKKVYPYYYKTIKKLMCFDMIFKKIKRKEYANISEFAADVELVFSNALTFNEEHSLIWEDATALKDYFRVLMSDLPEPHTLPEYAPTVNHAPAQNGKLKLRVPAPSQASVNATNTSNGTVSLKVKLPAAAAAPTPPPAHTTHSQSHASQSSRQSQQVPKQTTKSPNIAARPPLAQSQASQPPSTQTSSYLHPATFSHVNPQQPQPQYQYHSQPPSQTHSATHSTSPSPLPPTPTPPNATFDHPLRSVTLKTLPLGRTLRLDSSDGVRTWVLVLGKGETSIDIRDVRFLEVEESEEEEEDESGKASGKGEVVVKANGSPINAKVPNKKEGEGVWEVTELKAGTNLLEVGERAGEIWKIVLQRVGMKP
ncbi:Bromodomain-containing protein [Ramaria rubella]|nr:Bromodomain-containing protein [Ramaria rubella]